MQLQETAFRASVPFLGDERALTAVAVPDRPLDGRRDVARAGAMRFIRPGADSVFVSALSRVLRGHRRRGGCGRLSRGPFLRRCRFSVTAGFSVTACFRARAGFAALPKRAAFTSLCRRRSARSKIKPASPFGMSRQSSDWTSLKTSRTSWPIVNCTRYRSRDRGWTDARCAGRGVGGVERTHSAGPTARSIAASAVPLSSGADPLSLGAEGASVITAEGCSRRGAVTGPG